MSLLVHSCKSFLFPITEKWNFWVIGSTLAFVPSTQLNTLVKFTRDLHRARWVIFCSHYAWFLNSFQLSFSFLGISAQVRTAESADIAHIPMVAPPWSIVRRARARKIVSRGVWSLISCLPIKMSLPLLWKWLICKNRQEGNPLCQWLSSQGMALWGQGSVLLAGTSFATPLP